MILAALLLTGYSCCEDDEGDGSPYIHPESRLFCFEEPRPLVTDVEAFGPLLSGTWQTAAKIELEGDSLITTEFEEGELTVDVEVIGQNFRFLPSNLDTITPTFPNFLWYDYADNNDIGAYQLFENRGLISYLYLTEDGSCLKAVSKNEVDCEPCGSYYTR